MSPREETVSLEEAYGQHRWKKNGFNPQTCKTLVLWDLSGLYMTRIWLCTKMLWRKAQGGLCAAVSG